MGNGAPSYSRRAGGLSGDAFRALIEQARTRHELSDIIGRHTTLKKRGPRALVGLCPFHSERSPSLEVDDWKGTYHCFGCGAGGDAITFLMKCEGMTFYQAIETLTGEEFPTVPEAERARRKIADDKELWLRIEQARSIWARTVPAKGTPAEVYARSRGITAELPPTVRYVMTPRWRNLDTGEVGREYPAMACALQDRAGKVVGVQCVFLQDGGKRKFERIRDDGTKAKAKLSFGMIVGSALRLGPVQDHIVACEGPEDGLTLMQRLPGKSIWVSCGTAFLSRMEFPDDVNSVCFAGDNGAAGQSAVSDALTAAAARGLIGGSTFPPPEFKDWNDELRGIAA